jgi:hypothetical protein
MDYGQTYTQAVSDQMASIIEDVEWWEIERDTRPESGTTYGISIFGERITNGHGSLFAAINDALAVLAGRDVLRDETAAAQVAYLA